MSISMFSQQVQLNNNNDDMCYCYLIYMHDDT
jgi:hypothetical protein